MRRAATGLLVSAAAVFSLGSGAASAASFSGLESLTPHVRWNAAGCGGTFCLLVGDHGRAATAANPTPAAGAGQWHALDVDGSQQLTGVACPSASRCFAIDGHGVLTSATPAAAGTWHRVVIDPAHHLNAIACPTSGFCAAVDRAGGVITSRHPTGSRSAWHRIQLPHGHEDLQSVSCASATLCGAADLSPDVLISSRPSAGATAWKAVRIASCSAGFCGQMTRITCFSGSGCAAIELNVTDYYVHVSTRPASARSWRARFYTSYAHEGSPYGSISCGSAHLCLEADGGADESGDVFGQAAHLFTNSTSLHVGAALDYSSFDDPSGDTAPPYGEVRAAACGTAPRAPCVLADSAGNVVVSR